MPEQLIDPANRYPDIAATALREDLAAHLGVDPEQVAVGTGSSALCQQLVEIAATPGEEVLFPWRSFEAVEFATLEWVDWFNNRRLLEPVGNIPPAEAEDAYHAALEDVPIAA